MPPRLVMVVITVLYYVPGTGRAQDNYEIQLYSSETVAPGHTMVELVNGVIPTNHALHETVEIIQGINNWFETGFYIFTSYNQYGYGYGWVGDHIRPRFDCHRKSDSGMR